MSKVTTHALAPGDSFGRGRVLAEIRIPVTRTDRTSIRGARLVCDPELGGCGTVYEAALSDLMKKTGSTKSCGCLIREGNHTTHGLSRHGGHENSLYKTWTGMMSRCYNPEDKRFNDWGSRGIKVCPEWHDVRVFIGWIEANLGPRPEGCSLDRWPDNDGPYAPWNVRWATPTQQNQNSRAYIDGRCQHPLYNTWSQITRVSPGVLCERWQDFWDFTGDVERLLGQRPPGVYFRRTDPNGVFEPGNICWGKPPGRRKH